MHPVPVKVLVIAGMVVAGAGGLMLTELPPAPAPRPSLSTPMGEMLPVLPVERTGERYEARPTDF